MSRYEIEPDKHMAANDETFTLAIGWDRPMGTFFLQLAVEPSDPDDDPEIIHWIGGDFDECKDVDQLVEAAARYSSQAEGYRDRLAQTDAPHPDGTGRGYNRAPGSSNRPIEGLPELLSRGV